MRPKFAAAVEFSKTNRAALESCRETAAKTEKEQHCILVVPAP
jgi:hypothetical protein